MHREQVAQLAIDYEARNGSTEFIKASISALMLALVRKGVISEEELRAAFVDEIMRRGSKKELD